MLCSGYDNNTRLDSFNSSYIPEHSRPQLSCMTLSWVRLLGSQVSKTRPPHGRQEAALTFEDIDLEHNVRALWTNRSRQTTSRHSIISHNMPHPALCPSWWPKKFSIFKKNHQNESIWYHSRDSCQCCDYLLLHLPETLVLLVRHCYMEQLKKMNSSSQRHWRLCHRQQL